MKNLIDIVKNNMDVCNSSRHIQLIGCGGSGKTFLCFDAYLRLLENNDSIPIFIPLTETRIVDEGYSVFRFIERNFMNLSLIRSESVETQNTRIINMFKSSEKKIILFLDGVNEILDYSKNVMNPYGLFEEIRQLSELDNISLIITSRYKIYHEIFRSFSVYSVNPLSLECIETVKEKNGIKSTKDIESLLQSPFYLDKYIKSVNLKKLNSSEKLTGGELIDIYINHFILQFCQNNHLHEDSISALKLRFCLNVFLPELALYLYKNGSKSIPIVEMNKCFQTIKIALKNMEYEKDYYPYGEWWENYSFRELIDDYLLTTEIIYHNPENKGVFYFSHEDLFCFFCARWWLLHAEHFEDFDRDVVYVRNNYTIRKFIGELAREYCFQQKKSYLSETSPIEKHLQKTKGIFGDDNIARFNRECIEIMKISRYDLPISGGDRITADFSKLDLRFADFFDVNLENSSFQESLVSSSCFINYPMDSRIVFLYANDEIVIVGDIHAHVVCYSLDNDSILYNCKLSEQADPFVSVMPQIVNYFFDEKNMQLYVRCYSTVHCIDVINGKTIDSFHLKSISDGFYFDKQLGIRYVFTDSKIVGYDTSLKKLIQRDFQGFNSRCGAVVNGHIITYDGLKDHFYVFIVYRINTNNSIIQKCVLQIPEKYTDKLDFDYFQVYISDSNKNILLSFAPIEKGELMYGNNCFVFDIDSGSQIDCFETYGLFTSFANNIFCYCYQKKQNEYSIICLDLNTMEKDQNQEITDIINEFSELETSPFIVNLYFNGSQTIILPMDNLIVVSNGFLHRFQLFGSTGEIMEMGTNEDEYYAKVNSIGVSTYDLVARKFLSSDEQEELRKKLNLSYGKSAIVESGKYNYLGGILPYDKTTKHVVVSKELIETIKNKGEIGTVNVIITDKEQNEDSSGDFYCYPHYNFYFNNSKGIVVCDTERKVIQPNYMQLFIQSSGNLLFVFYTDSRLSLFLKNKNTNQHAQLLKKYNNTLYDGEYVHSCLINDELMVTLCNPNPVQNGTPLSSEIRQYSFIRIESNGIFIELVLLFISNGKEIMYNKKSNTIYVSTKDHRIYLIKIKNDGENGGIICEFEDIIHFLPSKVNGCDFSGVKISDDNNSNIIKILLDNGGTITT